MAWARVDDGWWAHPKVVGLDLTARGLWVSVLSWSCQHKTDRVPRQIVAMCGDDGTAAAQLVAAGLWVTDGDGWAIHDWDEYQSERARKAAAGRIGGQRSGEVRRSAQDTNEADDGASHEADQGASHEADDGASHEADAKQARPGPSQPVQQAQGGRKRRAPARPLPDDWQPTDAHRQLAADLKVACDTEAAKFRDHAAANDRRQRDWDASFRTWLRRSHDFRAGQGDARGSPDTGPRLPTVGSDDWAAREAEQRAREQAILGGAA